MPTFVPSLQVPKIVTPPITAKPAPAPASTSDALSLDALMARQKEIAASQQAQMQQPVASNAQGMSMLAWALVNGLRQRKAERDIQQGNADVASAMGQLNQTTGELPPDAMKTLMARNPDLGLEMYKTAMTLRAQRAKLENWVDIPSPEGSKEGVQWQQNSVTGEKRAVGGSGVTVNTGQPLPADVAGRIGMAQGFLKDYENILKEVDAGNLTGPIDYTTSVTFGRGSGGAAYRTIQSGVDALRRGLSGAGIGIAEAQDYVNRYAPGPTDDAPTLHSKLQGLHDDLLNVQDAVTQGRKIELADLGKRRNPPAETPAPDGTQPAPEPDRTVTAADPNEKAPKEYLDGGGTQEGWAVMPEEGRKLWRPAATAPGK